MYLPLSLEQRKVSALRDMFGTAPVDIIKSVSTNIRCDWLHMAVRNWDPYSLNIYSVFSFALL